MTAPARQSYYEIALTSRQVMTVFVVLLVAVLAAFLAGVWVGRQGDAPRVETVEAQAIEAAEEDGEAPLERLDFFSRDAEDAGPGDGEIDSAAAADEPPAMAPPIELADVEATAEEPEPEAAAPDEPAVVEEAPIDDEPAVAETRDEPTSDPPDRVAASPADGEATLVVQVFSSSNQVQAQAVVDRLRSGGYPALLSPVEVSGRTMYRVRIGPYTDRRVAEGVAEQVRDKFRLETWITE